MGSGYTQIVVAHSTLMGRLEIVRTAVAKEGCELVVQYARNVNALGE